MRSVLAFLLLATKAVPVSIGASRFVAMAMLYVQQAQRKLPLSLPDRCGFRGVAGETLNTEPSDHASVPLANVAAMIH